MVEASGAALVTAAAIPPDLRSPHTLGRIVLMQDGAWKPADPEQVFLPRDGADAESSSNAGGLVHTSVAADAEARRALRALGIHPESAESRFKEWVSRLLHDRSTPPSDPEWRLYLGPRA